MNGDTVRWRVAYDGIVRDEFWSEHFDRAAALAAYCEQRPWLARERVTLV